MAIITVSDEFFGELENLGRSRGFTPEVLAHKLLSAGAQHMRGVPQMGGVPCPGRAVVEPFNRQVATIIEARGDIGNACEMLDTVVRQMELLREQIESDAAAATVFNGMLGPVPVPTLEPEGAHCPLPPDPEPMPGPMPGPIEPGPRPHERHCFECDKQEVCEVKAKMDSIVTHPMISLFGHYVDRVWRNVASACDAYWPVGGQPILPLHENEGLVTDYIGEDGQVAPVPRDDGHDDLGSRHRDAQSTVTGVNAPDHRRVNLSDDGSQGEG